MLGKDEVLIPQEPIIPNEDGEELGIGSLFMDIVFIPKSKLLEILKPHASNPFCPQQFKVSAFIDYIGSLEAEEVSYQDLKKFAEKDSLEPWSVLSLACLSRQKAWLAAAEEEYAPLSIRSLDYRQYCGIFRNAIADEDFELASLASSLLTVEELYQHITTKLEFYLVLRISRTTLTKMEYLFTELQKLEPEGMAVFARGGIGSRFMCQGKKSYKCIAFFLSFIPQEERAEVIKDARATLEPALKRAIKAKDYEGLAFMLKTAPKQAKDLLKLALKVLYDEEADEIESDPIERIHQGLAELEKWVDKELFAAVIRETFQENKLKPAAVFFISAILRQYPELILAEIRETKYRLLDELVYRPYHLKNDASKVGALEDFNLCLRMLSPEDFRNFFNLFGRRLTVLLCHYQERPLLWEPQKGDFYERAGWLYLSLLMKIKESFTEQQAEALLTEVYKADGYRSCSKLFMAICHEETQDNSVDEKAAESAEGNSVNKQESRFAMFMRLLGKENFHIMLKVYDFAMVDFIGKQELERQDAILSLFSPDFESYKTTLSALLTVRQNRNNFSVSMDEELKKAIKENLGVGNALDASLNLKLELYRLGKAKELNHPKLVSILERSRIAFGTDDGKDLQLGYLIKQAKDLGNERLYPMILESFALKGGERLPEALIELIFLLDDKANNLGSAGNIEGFRAFSQLRSTIFTEACALWEAQDENAPLDEGKKAQFCKNCSDALIKAQDFFIKEKNQGYLEVLSLVALGLTALGVGFVAPVGFIIPLALVSLGSGYLARQKFFAAAESGKSLGYVEGIENKIEALPGLKS